MAGDSYGSQLSDAEEYTERVSFSAMGSAFAVPSVQQGTNVPQGLEERFMRLADKVGMQQNNLDQPFTVGTALMFMAAMEHNKLHNRIGRGIVSGGKAAGRGIAAGGIAAGRGIAAGAGALAKAPGKAWDTVSSQEAVDMYKQIGGALILNQHKEDSFLREQCGKLASAMQTATAEIKDFFTNKDRLGGKAIKAIKDAFSKLGTAIKNFFEKTVGPVLAEKTYKVADVMQDVGISIGHKMQDAADKVIAAAKKAGVTIQHGVGKAALAAARGLLKEGVSHTVTHTGKTAKGKRKAITPPNRSSARDVAKSARSTKRSGRSKGGKSL
jgi:hypothetical protein